MLPIRHKIPDLVGSILILFSIGCAERLPEPDPTVDVKGHSQVSISLMRSAETKDLTPMRIIISGNEQDRWIATVINQNDSTKKATFEIDKKTNAAKRLK